MIGESHFTMFTFPMSVPGRFRKSFVEGNAKDFEILDTLATEYGEDFNIWAKAMIGAIDHYAVIQ